VYACFETLFYANDHPVASAGLRMVWGFYVVELPMEVVASGGLRICF